VILSPKAQFSSRLVLVESNQISYAVIDLKTKKTETIVDLLMGKVDISGYTDLGFII
jgi:hypothetical protein